MINSIVFSKDRAAQLDLLIRSIKKNSDSVFDLKVLFTYSNEKFKEGYDKLQTIYPEIKWIKESNNFKQDVATELENTEHRYSCFFTDDDILYREVTEEDMISKLEEDAKAFCFSTRLGMNTTKCYTMRCDNVIIPLFQDEKYIQWDWHLHYADFHYPLSVDGHIFRTDEILKLTKKVSFTNPNTYEANLQIFDNFPRNHMWAFSNSVLVNSPSNIVQNTFQNRQGESFGVSVQSLNDDFLSGRLIDLESIDFSNIEGCHQELSLPIIELIQK